MLHLLPIAHVATAKTKCCPWCGSEPGLAMRRGNFWLVGCESDECAVNPQTSSTTSVEDAWKKWNSRI